MTLWFFVFPFSDWKKFSVKPLLSLANTVCSAVSWTGFTSWYMFTYFGPPTSSIVSDEEQAATKLPSVRAKISIFACFMILLFFVCCCL